MSDSTQPVSLITTPAATPNTTPSSIDIASVATTITPSTEPTPATPLIRLPSVHEQDIHLLPNDQTPTNGTITSPPSASSSSQTDPSPTSTNAALSPPNVSTTPSLYILQSPEPVVVTAASLTALATQHGRRASLSSKTGNQTIAVEAQPTTTESTIEPSTVIPPTSTPSPPPPTLAPPRADHVLEFVALYSYDTSPFARTSHSAGGPSGFDFISGGALKGSLEYRIPASKDRPKGEDMPDSLEHFVFPELLRFETEPTAPLLHSFVMTLANGGRMYAYVYTKWHQVPDHVLTVVKMQIGENLIDCDDPSPQHLPSTLYGPHSLVFISSYPFYDSLTTTLKYMAERFFMVHVPQQAYISPGTGTASVPIGHPSLACSTQLIDAIYHAFRDVSPLRVPLSQMDLRASELYPRAFEFRDAVTSMCALQYHPPSAMSPFQQPQPTQSTEDGSEHDEIMSSMMTNFVLDVSPASLLPSDRLEQMNHALRTCIEHCPFFLPAAPFDNLPLLEATTIGTLFDSLDLSHIIAVWNALLCELPCLFVSEHICKLTPTLEALSALLYPFKWPYVYIPVLPIFLTEVLDAPQPFLIGAPRAVLDGLPDALVNGENNIVIVDLDNNTLCMSGNFQATQRRQLKLTQFNECQAAIIAAGGKPSAKFVEDPADANPFPDPFVTNTKLLTLLLQSQGVGQDESAAAQLERLLANNPVTYLGASILDSVSLAPTPLTLSDLNPFKSSNHHHHHHPSNSNAPASLDGLGGSSHHHSHGHHDHGDDHDPSQLHLDHHSSSGGGGTNPERHRFLPWNLVWRLYDGVGSILNPLLAQQREMDAERQRAGTLTSPPPLLGAANMSTRASLSHSSNSSHHSSPSAIYDVSNPIGGMALLSNLPPSLPTHAWPVLLPGLVRELRAQLIHGSRNNNKLLDLDLHDPNLGNSLMYLGNEPFFLQRFQALLEKTKKPVLLLSTTNFLYSGTSCNESDSDELADDEPTNGALVPTSTSQPPNSQATNTPPHRGSPYLGNSISQRTQTPTGLDDDDDRSSRSSLQPSSLASTSSLQTPPNSHHHHHQHAHSAAAFHTPEPGPPTLLHMTSNPEMHMDNSESHDAASEETLPSLQHLLSNPEPHREKSPPPFMHPLQSHHPALPRATSASVASTSGMTTHVANNAAAAGSSSARLTPMTSEDEADDEADEKEDTIETNSVSSSTLSPSSHASSTVTSPTKIVSPHSKRLSEPSLGFKGKIVSPFRNKQASISHLAPPKLMPAYGDSNANKPSEHESSTPLTPLTPSTPAVFASAPSVTPLGHFSSRVTDKRDSLVVPSDSRRMSVTFNPPSTQTVTEDGSEEEVQQDAEFDMDLIQMPVRGRERASLINEVIIPAGTVLTDTNPLQERDASPQSISDLSAEPILIAVHAPSSVDDLFGDKPTTVDRRSSMVSPTRASVTACSLPLRELASSSSANSIWASVGSTELLSLRRRFLSVFVSLLHSHRAFTGFARKELGSNSSAPDEEESYEIIFENASFLRYVHRDYRPFLSLFIETQMMKFFTEERLTRESTATTTTASSTANNLKNSREESSQLAASLPSTPSHPSAPSTAISPTTNAPTPSIPNDWFDRLCAQKRTRTRLLMNAAGENGLAGLLYKLGRKVPTWKERWFELNRHGTILRYYAHSTKMTDLEISFKELKRRHKLSPKDLVTKANLDRVADQREKLRESLYRGEITIVPGQTLVLIPNQTRKYMTCYCFEVITKDRSLLACAPDLTTRDDWILCIRGRAAKLSIDHKRAGGGLPSLGLGTIPHLESRLQMQLRLLREKNIASLTKNFMEEVQRRQKQFKAGEEGCKDVVETRKQKKLISSSSSVSNGNLSTSNSTVSQQPVPLSLPHALLVCEHLRTSLDLRKFSTLFRTHQHCFSGRDATNYILHQNLCDSLQDAITLCNLMLTSGLILNVNHSASTPFKSEVKSMYTFPASALLHGAGIGGGESSASSLLPTEEERVIVARMREELDVRDRVHGLFRTQDAIIWLLDRGICSNESAAIRLATRLVRTSQMIPVQVSFVGTTSSPTASGSASLYSSHEFENNHDLYKFHASIKAMNSASQLLDNTTAASKTRTTGKK